MDLGLHFVTKMIIFRLIHHKIKLPSSTDEIYYFFLFLCQLAWAQIPIPVNYDTIYNDDIASLKCNVSGLPLTLPLIELGKDVNISISYDDLGRAQHRYRYEIIHVDKNWHETSSMNLNTLRALTDQRSDRMHIQPTGTPTTLIILFIFPIRK